MVLYKLSMPPQVEVEVPFSAEKKARLHELERVIERSLQSFLECGRALLQVRDEQLYRPLYASFGDYLVKRWGITYSQGASLMRSTLVAEILLAGPAGPEGDAPLPEHVAEATLRPLQKLSPELQCAVWRLSSRITEKPTANIVSRIVRTVTAAIQAGESGVASDASTANEAKRAQKAIFLASINRLASGESFSAQIIALRVSDAAQARRCVRSCRELIARCEALVRQLQYRFPEL
jgi:hypothetical protein